MTKLWIVFCVVLVTIEAVSALPPTISPVQIFNDAIDAAKRTILKARYFFAAAITENIRKCDTNDSAFWQPQKRMEYKPELKLGASGFYLDESVHEVDDVRCKEFLQKMTKARITHCAEFLLDLMNVNKEDMDSKANLVLEYLRSRKIDLSSNKNLFEIEFDEGSYREQIEEIRRLVTATGVDIVNFSSQVEWKMRNFVRELGHCLVSQAGEKPGLSREWYNACWYYTKNKKIEI